jgi:hypothetical protein
MQPRKKPRSIGEALFPIALWSLFAGDVEGIIASGIRSQAPKELPQAASWGRRELGLHAACLEDIEDREVEVSFRIAVAISQGSRRYSCS